MISFFLSKYPGDEWLHHVVDIVYSFSKLPNCFLTLLYHVAFTPVVHENSSCSTSFPTLGTVTLFNFSHSRECNERTSQGPHLAHCLFLQIKFNWNTVVHTCLYFLWLFLLYNGRVE